MILADLAAISGVFYFQSLATPVYWVSLVLFPILFYIFDLYYPYKIFKPALTFFEIVVSVFTGSLILAALSYADRSFILARTIFLSTLPPIIPLVFLVRMTYDGLFKSRFLDKRTLLLGTGSLAKDFVLTLENTPHSGILLVGALASDAKDSVKKGGALGRISVLGSTHDLETFIVKQQIQMVVIALDPLHDKEETEVLAALFQRKIAVTSASHVLERLTGVLPRPLMEDTHYILSMMADVKMRPYMKLKRILDFMSALVLLVLFSPVLLMAILLLALSGPQQIFFVQERVGLNEIPFQLIKLRSMMKLKGGRMRVTWLGRWLRKYRIDEMPQLLNVLKGDMALVGPRPEIPFFVNRSLKKIPMYKAIFALKPGLTGWAQVKFRYTTSVKDYREKFRYNLFYLKNMSFTLDILILFKTVRIVLLGTGQ